MLVNTMFAIMVMYIRKNDDTLKEIFSNDNNISLILFSLALVVICIPAFLFFMCEYLIMR